MKLRNRIIIFALSAAALSCVKNEVVPSNVDSTVKFAEKSIEVAKSGETKIVGIRASGDWSLFCDCEWVKVSPESGTKATKDITVTVESENTGDSAREAKIIISDVQFPANKDTLLVSQKSNIGFAGKIKDLDSFNEFMELASSFSDTENIELLADIDLKGATIKPIESFSATLDGKGHRLYNFVIESGSTLAGFILENKGTVKNLIIGSAQEEAWDKTSTIKFATTDIQASAAGFVAVNSGKIQNVKNFASVDFNAKAAADAAVGGVAGTLTGAEAGIEDCLNGGSVNFSGTASGRAHQGGVLGANLSSDGVVIQNCVNKGAVVKSNINQKEFSIGGVIARTQVQTTIKGCKNHGLVSYEASETPGSYIHIGGVLGAGFYGTVLEDCSNAGEIFSRISQVNRMGGIVGTINTGGSVLKCKNIGKVGVENSGNDNWQAVGGILGFEEKAAPDKFLIRECRNAGELYVILNNNTTHKNKIGLGGIAGILCSPSALVENNTNTGKVHGSNSGSASLYVGGIVAWYLKGSGFKTKDNVNSGEISADANDCAAGGIIGNSSVNGSRHEGDANKGAIKCKLASATGAVAGLNDALISACSIMGSVNDVEIDASNFAGFIQGSSSKGTESACFYGNSGADYIVVDPAELSFSASSGTKTVTVSSNCEWTVVSSESWLTLNANEGSGASKSISASVAENTQKEPRSASITFTSKTDASKTATVSVTQAKAEAGLAENKIKNLEDLKKFVSIAADAVSSDVYTLEADIDCAGATISPIVSFAGVLDGKNYKITNVKIESGQNMSGFILANEGTVKNLIFGEGGSITFSSDVTSASAAAFVAVNKGLVENVSNYASVTFNVPTSSADASVAGVVGRLESENAKVSGCKNYGTVILSGALSARAAIAGVVGTSLKAGAVVENCHNYAAVEYSKNNEKELALAGVLARASNASTIRNCTNEGAVSYTYSEAVSGSYLHIAGVVGASYKNSEILDCVNKGKVYACIKNTVRLGGIVATMNAGGKISGCTNSGSLEFAQEELSNKIWFAIGGIVGFEEKAEKGLTHEISSCKNAAPINAKFAHSNNSHGNKIAVGGILGSSCSDVSLKNNSNSGNLTVKNTGETSVYCGGVLGFYQKGKTLKTSSDVNSANVSLEAKDGAAGGVFGNVSTAVEKLEGDTNFGSVSFGEDNRKSGSIAGLTSAALKSCKVGGSVNGTVLNAENFSLYIQGTDSKGSHSECVFITK